MPVSGLLHKKQHNLKKGLKMIKLKEVMTDEQKIILSIFDKEKIQKTKKGLAKINKKNEKFLKDLERLKKEIKFNFEF
jgi:IS1 family transposase